MHADTEFLVVPTVFPKVCRRCDRVHTETSWKRLAWVGIQPADEYSLELRNCDCGTTLARIVGAEVLQ